MRYDYVELIMVNFTHSLNILILKSILKIQKNNFKRFIINWVSQKNYKYRNITTSF